MLTLLLANLIRAVLLVRLLLCPFPAGVELCVAEEHGWFDVLTGDTRAGHTHHHGDGCASDCNDCHHHHHGDDAHGPCSDIPLSDAEQRVVAGARVADVIGPNDADSAPAWASTLAACHVVPEAMLEPPRHQPPRVPGATARMIRTTVLRL